MSSSIHRFHLASFIIAIAVSVACYSCNWNRCAASPRQTEDPEARENRLLKNRDDAQLLNGLRARRLFETAEFYCQQQLAKPVIDPTSQSLLVIELMKTRTSKAVLTDPEIRAEVWQSAVEAAGKFLKDNPNHPRRFLVKVQHALIHIAHSQLLRQEIDADMATATARPDALEQIKQARTLLNNLQREIAKAIPDQRSKCLTDYDLSPEQLLNLENNVRYQLAVCNLGRAQLYEVTDRLNRIDALSGVQQRLIEVQRSASEGQPLWWKTKLGQVECLRLLGNAEGARTLAQELPRKTASPSTKLVLLEQKLRVAIELGDEKYARSLVTEFESLPRASAQLELAVLELLVDLAARSPTEDRKQEWLAYAAKFSQSLEQIYGGYWGRRADLILIGATGVADNTTRTEPKFSPITKNNSPKNLELDLLIRLADEAYQKSRFDDALKAYGRASRMAVSTGANDRALEMDLRSSLIMEQQKRHSDAAATLIESANRDQKIEMAPLAHLRGCWNFAQTLNTEPAAKKQRLVEYQQLLIDHLSTWPTSSSTDQARVYLGKLFQSQQKWNSAIEVFLAVAPESPQIDSAIYLSTVCGNNSLISIQQNKQPTESQFRKIDAWFATAQRAFPKTSSNAMRLELSRAELDLVFGSHRPNSQITERLETIANSTDLKIATTAQAILAISICADDFEKAKKIAGSLATDETSLSRVERCLAAVGNSNQNTAGSEVDRLRLDTIEKLLLLDSKQKNLWLIKKSDALMRLSRHADAIDVLSALEKEFPNNANVKMQLARAMTIHLGKSDPEQPLNKWRRVAERLKPYSANWLEAKHEVAKLLLESGNKVRANKLLKYIQLTPPGWKNSKLESSFESLLKKSE